jgi:hypothetical protein
MQDLDKTQINQFRGKSVGFGHKSVIFEFLKVFGLSLVLSMSSRLLKNEAKVQSTNNFLQQLQNYWCLERLQTTELSQLRTV